jgi:uncharacterized protein (DUF362 family)
LLTGVAGGAVAALLGRGGADAAATRARVVRVQSDKVWKGDVRDPEVVAAMVDGGIVALTGAPTAAAAWSRVFTPQMRVGLKVNLLGRPFSYTAPEVTDAVLAGALAAGVKPENVIVWDRKKSHFEQTAYRFGRGKHGESVEPGGVYDPARTCATTGGPCPVDVIPVDRTDVTVNLPVLKNHRGAGVTLALKNIAFGCYENHRSAHDNNCDPFVAEAYAHFVSLAKVPLIVLDATEGCCDGGPRPSDRGRLWRENAVYLATDPVALDVECRKLVMRERAARKLPDTRTDCHHIETAAARGIGIGDPSRIEVVTVKV